jgi:preprotein translocase SecE subunit
MKYIKDRVSELHNITWPTRKQAIHSMILVLVIMLLTGLFLGIVDNIFSLGTNWIFSIVK